MNKRSAITRLATSVVVPGLCGDTLPDWIDDEVERGLAAVCWFGGATLDELKSRFPDLLVLSDEEGGTVTRLEAAAGSSSPGNAVLGALDEVAVTEQVAAGLGAMARDAGIDVVLAPVVDVNSEADNPVIGVRSFGADADLVGRHGVAFVRGVQSQGVAACAKHFPGHGATRTDSHVGLPIVTADREAFVERDVAPFAAAIDAGVRCVLTAHVSVPAVDPTPATLSRTWLTMLRDELGFDGVVVSDAMDMHAIARGVGRAPGAAAALRAGIDLVSIGNPCFPDPYDGAVVFGQVRDHVASAITDGTLMSARVEQAAARVRALARWLATTRQEFGPPDRARVEAARLAARRAAADVLRPVGDVRLAGAPHLVIEQQHTNIAAGRPVSPLVAALSSRHPATTYSSVATVSDVPVALRAAAGRPIVVVTDGLCGNAVVDAVRGQRRDAVVVDVGPQSRDGPRYEAPLVLALGTSAVGADAVADLLVSGR
jgi:beta-N-acetylhexosaminidase